MRAAIACHFEVTCFDAWRRSVAVLMICVVTALVLWLLARRAVLPGAVVVAAVLGLAAAGGLGTSLMQRQPFCLRWSGSQWFLTGPTQRGAEEDVAGALAVALDLGNWMLLRFEPDTSRGRRHRAWLPVARSGLGPRWHTLRCAVYSARPVPDRARDPGAAADL